VLNTISTPLTPVCQLLETTGCCCRRDHFLRLSARLALPAAAFVPHTKRQGTLLRLHLLHCLPHT
jgi:hypothetical protein